MEHYTSPEDALSDLKKKGYDADLNTDSFCLYCSDLDLRLNPGAYHVDEAYTFEEPSHPQNNEVVYAISSCTGVKGTLVDANDADPNWKKDSHVPDRE